jgi:hypothetical protein
LIYSGALSREMRYVDAEGRVIDPLEEAALTT